MINSHNGSPPPNAHLMQALEFDDADLAANRKGLLSDPQKARLRSRFVQSTILTLLVASVPLTFVVMSIVILATSNQYSSSSDSSLVVIVMIIIVFVLIMGLIPLFSIITMWRRNRMGLAEGVVSSIEGTIDLTNVGGKRYALYVTDDAGRELGFNIRKRASRAFGEGMRYRVYFIPANGYVVAAEELDH